MTRTDCPTAEELLLLLEESDSAPEAAAHLAGGCTACTQRVASLRRMLTALAAPPLAAVPPAWHRRAVAIAEAPVPEGGGLLGRVADQVREFVATLIPPAAAPTPAFVLRGELSGGWRRLYRAGPYEVDLGLLEGGELVGQVEPLEEDAGDLAGAWCCLFGEEGAHEAKVEANGDFLFERVSVGRYALSLEGAAARLVLPEIAVGFAEGGDPGVPREAP